MDNMLKNFQNNLANISNEIRHLQQYSAELNIKKKNREVVREQLSQVVDEMVVPQSMIQYDEFIDEIMRVFFSFGRIIMDVPVTERQFLEQLHELSHKIKFVKERSFHDALACQDVQEVLEKLRIKVNIEFEISLKSISFNRQSVKFGNLSYKKSINFVNQ